MLNTLLCFIDQLLGNLFWRTGALAPRLLSRLPTDLPLCAHISLRLLSSWGTPLIGGSQTLCCLHLLNQTWFTDQKTLPRMERYLPCAVNTKCLRFKPSYQPTGTLRSRFQGCVIRRWLPVYWIPRELLYLLIFSFSHLLWAESVVQSPRRCALKAGSRSPSRGEQFLARLCLDCGILITLVQLKSFLWQWQVVFSLGGIWDIVSLVVDKASRTLPNNKQAILDMR